MFYTKFLHKLQKMVNMLFYQCFSWKEICIKLFFLFFISLFIISKTCSLLVSGNITTVSSTIQYTLPLVQSVFKSTIKYAAYQQVQGLMEDSYVRLINCRLHLFRSSASSFSSQYLLLFLKLSRICVLLLLTPFASVICPSMASWRTQSLIRLWPIQLTFLQRILFRRVLFSHYSYESLML